MAPEIRLGTSSFTAAGWSGAFYPIRMRQAEYLSFYSSRFDTVEVDSTFYAIPTIETVENWARKTPAGFVFSLKAPQVITHEKVLMNCDWDCEKFVQTVSFLGEKLGPIVFQFPFFNESVFDTPVQFLSRLKPFLKGLDRFGKRRYAVEIRNKHWLKPRFLDLLREHNVALVLQGYGSDYIAAGLRESTMALRPRSWMPGPLELFEKIDPITADFTYIRWLGDRKEIEKITTVWNKTVVERTAELRSWVDVCQKIKKRGVTQYVYANNHYAGFAPATIEQFRRLCAEKGIETPLKRSGVGTCGAHTFRCSLEIRNLGLREMSQQNERSVALSPELSRRFIDLASTLLPLGSGVMLHLQSLCRYQAGGTTARTL
jgi:uncharacterized protein YecE (DUF72 family)